jgi:Putative MetA-pathway of phenol degradation
MIATKMILNNVAKLDSRASTVHEREIYSPHSSMAIVLSLARLIVALTCSRQVLQAQDLAPRAYVITPLHSNAIILIYSFYDGSVLLDGAVPVTNASGMYSVSVLSYYHSFRFFNRSANISTSLPYAIGTFQASLIGEPEQIYRSGLADSEFRVSVNLKGAPAMSAERFVKWKQKTLLGVSLKMTVPTGQYDPNRLINWGSNRWALKPEFGYSERWNNCVLMRTLGFGSIARTPSHFRSLSPSVKRRDRSVPSKAISAMI